MLTIATFNVNSVHARLMNLLQWIDEVRPDIVLLQELKCLSEAFPAMELEERGYNLAVHGQKTYNGVAILSKFPLEDVTRALPGEAEDTQARYIEAVANVPGGTLRVASVYVPNGQEVGSDKFTYKLRFLERLASYWRERLMLHERAVLGGDFNVAPAAIDVYDARALDGSVCYHPAERERLRALLNLGLYDAFRITQPDRQQFSWWDYRAGSYARGHGMRIDHLLLSASAADCLLKAWVDETPRQQEKPSDHAPMLATLAV
jgi:exodeoxyribonuclease-3